MEKEEKDDTIQIAGTVSDSIVDGEGMRYTIFCQGCPRRCPGCQNPETQPRAGGRPLSFQEVLMELMENPLLTGVTFSGGEPFLQSAPLARLADLIHGRGLDIWCYTGYTLEELQNLPDPSSQALLQRIDVLVDGEYREAERDLTLRFRGSRNQRVIDMQKTRKKGNIVLFYPD